MTARTQHWLVVLCALLAVGIYWTVWADYTKLHTVTRYVAAAPGAPAVGHGQTLRVLSLTRTTTLISDDSKADPQVASPGGEYVLAELEVTVDQDTAYPDCSPLLVGPDHRVWEKSTPENLSRDRVLCSDFKAGVPTRVEAIYEVPSRYADHLYGLAMVDPAVTDPAVVLTPPR